MSENNQFFSKLHKLHKKVVTKLRGNCLESAFNQPLTMFIHQYSQYFIHKNNKNYQNTNQDNAKSAIIVNMMQSVVTLENIHCLRCVKT